MISKPRTIDFSEGSNAKQVVKTLGECTSLLLQAEFKVKLYSGKAIVKRPVKIASVYLPYSDSVYSGTLHIDVNKTVDSIHIRTPKEGRIGDPITDNTPVWDAVRAFHFRQLAENFVDELAAGQIPEICDREVEISYLDWMQKYGSIFTLGFKDMLTQGILNKSEFVFEFDSNPLHLTEMRVASHTTFTMIANPSCRELVAQGGELLLRKIIEGQLRSTIQDARRTLEEDDLVDDSKKDAGLPAYFGTPAPVNNPFWAKAATKSV